MRTVSFWAKNLYYCLVWLLLGVILFSCEPDPIGIDLPAHEPKLVISTQILPRNFMVVQVSKSFSSLAGKSDSLSLDSTFLQSLIINHALVQISGNGNTEILRRVGPGLYLSRRIMKEYGQHYSLFVKDSVSGLECTAATVMLPTVQFDNVKPTINRTAKDTAVTLEFELTDPGTERNFFMITYAGASRKNVLPWQGISSIKPVEEQ